MSKLGAAATIGIKADGHGVNVRFVTIDEARSWIERNWNREGAWYAGTKTWQITRGQRTLREVQLDALYDAMARDHEELGEHRR